MIFHLIKFQLLNNYDRRLLKIIGISKQAATILLEIIYKASLCRKSRRGRPPKVGLDTRLVITLLYLRHYMTMEYLAFQFGLSKSTVCDIIHWTENALVSDGRLHAGDSVIVDATDVRVCRPKRRQHKYYSGKRKYHSLKAQIVIDAKTLRILSVHTCSGAVHEKELCIK